MLTRIIFTIALLITAGIKPTVALDASTCAAQGGIVVNNLMGKGCPTGKNIGEVSEMKCPCICCTGEKLIDCEKNTVEIYDVCDAGNELHYKFKSHGSETPANIEIRLMNKNDSEYSAKEVRSIIDTRQEQQTAGYEYDFMKNQNYVKLISYQVYYKDYTLGGCKKHIMQSPIPVKPCAK